MSTGPQMHDEDNYVASFFSDPSYRQRACEHLADSMKEREQVQALDGVLDQSEEMATFLLSYGDFRHDRLCPVPCARAAAKALALFTSNHCDAGMPTVTHLSRRMLRR